MCNVGACPWCRGPCGCKKRDPVAALGCMQAGGFPFGAQDIFEQLFRMQVSGRSSCTQAPGSWAGVQRSSRLHHKGFLRSSFIITVAAAVAFALAPQRCVRARCACLQDPMFSQMFGRMAVQPIRISFMVGAAQGTGWKTCADLMCSLCTGATCYAQRHFMCAVSVSATLHYHWY